MCWRGRLGRARMCLALHETMIGDARLASLAVKVLLDQIAYVTFGLGQRERIAHTRNEAWDLLNYCIGVCISKLINIERIDWDNPPKWASAPDSNELVRSLATPKAFANVEKQVYDLSELARKLA